MKMIQRIRFRALIAWGFMIFYSAVGSSSAQSVEEFYRGKQVRIIIHSTPGGDYDLWARLLGRYMAKYLPGGPTFVPQNMPGAGGITAANALYARMPRDGSVVGTIGRNLPYQALMKVQNVQFDPVQFGWIGSPQVDNTVSIVAGDAPAKTARDLFQHEVLMGGAGAGTSVSLLPVFLNRLMGMKFKLVEGYSGTSAIWLAMERKEVHGVFLVLSTAERAHPGAIAAGRLRVLFNMERAPIPGTNVPSIFEFAKSEEERGLLGLLAISNEFGHPIVTPPDVPEDRIAALRSAFEATVRDPELKAEAAKAGLSVVPTSGPSLLGLVRELMSTAPELIGKMRDLSN